MSFMRLVSKPFERLTPGVNTVEVAAVGASVFTIGWLVRHFHGTHPLSEPDAIEGEKVDSTDCLDHEDVYDFWRPWDSDRFLPTEKCFHPLERIKSYDLELANSEVIPSEAESVKPLSLVLNDGVSSSYSCAPEWQSCTRGLLQKDEFEVEDSTQHWFSFIKRCCCFANSQQVLPLDRASTTDDFENKQSSSSFVLVDK